jgi:hypothetical protein
MKSQPFTIRMRSHSKPKGHEEEEIERLLAQLRRQVAQLHRLERASPDTGDLDAKRRTIADLHWRLARVAGDHSRRSLVAG